jgi:hypothetical protein
MVIEILKKKAKKVYAEVSKIEEVKENNSNETKSETVKETVSETKSSLTRGN